MTMAIRPLRAVMLIAASSGAAWWLVDAARDLIAPPLTLEALLTTAVLACGAAASGGMALSTVTALVQALAGRRPRAAEALPAPLRRFLAGTVAAALAAGAAIPASADEAYPGWAPTVPTASASPSASAAPSATPAPSAPSAPSPTPAPSPSAQPPATPLPAPPSDAAKDPVVELHEESWVPALPEPTDVDSHGPAEPATAGAIHIVVHGESLWVIAKGALSPGASNAEIDSAWPLIYAANREVIGADAALIQPGQTLVIPADVMSTDFGNTEATS